MGSVLTALGDNSSLLRSKDAASTQVVKARAELETLLANFDASIADFGKDTRLRIDALMLSARHEMGLADDSALLEAQSGALIHRLMAAARISFPAMAARGGQVAEEAQKPF